ncbi:hypothetical protein [Nesterenkonia sp. K-15-9-6]|uniref:hypothetical protein n=1 Tax=Nesterenkonia sp. K-15-9-6 TaxID=3093918 RepID=UPI0040441151
MPISPAEAKPLKEAVAEFANMSASLRALEADELWCQAEGRTPGPNLLALLDAARIKWRKAHTRVYKLIDDMTEEKP